jgi:autotransporter-associated beta strand protein/T5SS/PEP-CTERM-associated repeat protein
LAAFAAGSVAAQTTSVNVPDGSFESPSAASPPYYVQYPADDGATVGAWLGAGFVATVQAGGPNAYNVSPAEIDGTQFADLGCTAWLFQDTAPYDGSGDPNLYWQAGYTYTLTVGFFTRGDSPVPAANVIDMMLYYRSTRTGGANVLGTTAVVGSEVNPNALTDETLTVSVSAGDPEVGQPIGIWLYSITSSAGDWGMDNVRLTMVPGAVAPPSGGLVLTNGDASPQLTLVPTNVVAALHFGNDTNTYSLQGVNFVDVSGIPNNLYFTVTDFSGGEGDGFKAGVPTLGTGDTNDLALDNICNSFFWGEDSLNGFNYLISGLSPYSTNQIEFVTYIGGYGPRTMIITANSGGNVLSQTKMEINGQPINTSFSIVVDGSGTISGRFQGLTVGAWINALIITSQGQGPVPVYSWSGTPTGDWDINTTVNWILSLNGNPGSPSVWTNGLITRFDDTASTTTVNETTIVAPIMLTVSNNIKNYTFTGSGSIIGPKLLKEGSGTMTVLSTNVFGNGINGSSEIQNGEVVFADHSSNSVAGQLLIASVPGMVANFVLTNNASLRVNDLLYTGYSVGSTGILMVADNSVLNETGGWISIGGSGAAIATFQDNASCNASSASIFVGDQTGSQGTWNLQGNSQITAFSIYVGGTTMGGAVGVVNQTGGTVTSVGSAEIQVGSYGQGTWNQSGGTNAAPGWLSIGRQPGSTGLLNVSGNAVFNQTSSSAAILVGEAGTGTLEITNTGIVNSASTAYGVLVGWDSTGVGTVNLDGGMLVANLVQGGQGSGIFNFNGGTLKAAPGANTNFMSYLSSACVLAGGAIIDTYTNDITILQSLYDGGGGGGLNKLGNGTLLLDSDNYYAGTTTVSAGTLGGSGSILGVVTVGSGAALCAGDGYANGAGFTVGSVTLNGTVVANLSKDSGSPMADLLSVNAPLTYNGALRIVNVGTNELQVDDSFTIFSGTSYGGMFNRVVSQTPGQTVTWDTKNLAVNGSIRWPPSPQLSPSRRQTSLPR